MTGEDRKKPQKRTGRRGKIRRSVPEMEESMETESCAVNREHEKMIRWLQTVKFRRVLFGGIDEAQLWKKLEELDRLYEAALREERARYDGLLDAQKERDEAD